MIEIINKSGKVDIKTASKLEVKEVNNNIEIYRCGTFTMPLINGFDTFSEALNTLGVGKLFYLNPTNLEGATPYSVHLTQ